MLIVKRLKEQQFARLKDIFNDEFDSDVPETENSEILGAFEDSQLVGFVLVEDVKMIGQIWTRPDKRNDSVNIVQALLKQLREKYEGKAVIGAVASQKRFVNLYRSLRFQRIAGEFFRRNFTKG
jgi:predicted GNAT family N-acyltransferase